MSTADIPDALIEKAADAAHTCGSISPDDIARAVLAAVVDEIRADAWDEGRKARGIYVGPDNGHEYDCAGWEDCHCAVYPNPYRKEDPSA